jgi:hypothetical protein
MFLQMAKKVSLKVRPEPVLFTLLGISCHLKDYRLSYLLNNNLGIFFTKHDDLRISAAGSRDETEFSFYLFRDEERLNTYYLIANRSQDFVLVPELKQFDFLLVVEGAIGTGEKEFLLKIIRGIPGVLTVVENELTGIKNYENLLTDVEMHMMNIQKSTSLKYQPKSI